MTGYRPRAIARLYCGTHFGDTKAVASIAARPVALRRSMSATLTSVAIVAFSFCRPSRGPTSTILTLRGRLIGRSSYYAVSFNRSSPRPPAPP